MDMYAQEYICTHGNPYLKYPMVLDSEYQIQGDRVICLTTNTVRAFVHQVTSPAQPFILYLHILFPSY